MATGLALPARRSPFGHIGGTSARDPPRSAENRQDLICRLDGRASVIAEVRRTLAQDPAHRPTCSQEDISSIVEDAPRRSRDRCPVVAHAHHARLQYVGTRLATACRYNSRHHLVLSTIRLRRLAAPGTTH